MCTYLNKGAQRVTLMTIPGERVTALAVRSLSEDLHSAEFGADRRCVAVYEFDATEDAFTEAVSQDITLIRLDRLGALDQALHDATVAAARHRALEITALMKVYDPPVPVPFQAAVTPDGPEPLLETDGVAVFMRDRGGDEVLITFANQWLRHNGRAFWADSVSKALNISVVGFVAKDPTWFPPDDMLSLLPEVAKILDGRFPTRICYGHSQGGYGAIKFSRALGATTVLAFSPQYAIDARIVQDERVNKYYAGRLHAGMAITPNDTAGKIFVFYDPADLADSVHAARISAVSDIKEVKLPFVGHASDRGMGTAAHFAGLLAAARTGDADAVRRFVARNRAVRVERPVVMALRLAATKPRLAAAILDKHGARWKPDQITAVCYRLAMAGVPELAFDPALRAAEAAPGNATGWGAAGLIAMEQRRLDVAFQLVEKALALEPYNEKWRNAAHRVQTLAMAESVAKAAATGGSAGLF
jgi:hypothetical protein